MLGLIIFYINVPTQLPDSFESQMQIIKNQNQSLLEKLIVSGYEPMFVAVYNEATRIEKITLDPPSEEIL